MKFWLSGLPAIPCLLVAAAAPLPPAAAQDALPPVTAPPAYSVARAATELLGIDAANVRTNARYPLCVLFVLDVSGSMGAKSGSGSTRLERAVGALRALLESDGLSHPLTHVGVLRAGREDPGDDYRSSPAYVVPFRPRREVLDGWPRLLARLRLESAGERGSNLRAAHLRGLRALERFALRERPRRPDVLWRRYLVLLSDGYLRAPEPDSGSGTEIFRRLQDRGSADYRVWRQLIRAQSAKTLMVEPYHDSWQDEPATSDCVFPSDLSREVLGLREEDTARLGMAVVEGICLRGPGGTVGSSVLRRLTLEGYRQTSGEHSLPAARVECRVLESGTEIERRELRSDMGGRFFFPVAWAAGREDGSRVVRLRASKLGFAPAELPETLRLRPGDHLVFAVSLAPSTDWRPGGYLVAAFLAGGLLLWPWDLRVNQRSAGWVHLFRPVHLRDPQTHRRVATIWHLGCIWLAADGHVQVRVNGMRSWRVRPLPPRCQLAVVTTRTTTFLVESGFLTPGRLLRGRRERRESPRGA